MSDVEILTDTYERRIRERLVDIREAATDVVSWSVHSGDRRTLRWMNEIFSILNQAEAVE